MIYSMIINTNNKTNLVVLFRMKFLISIVGPNCFNSYIFDNSFLPALMLLSYLIKNPEGFLTLLSRDDCCVIICNTLQVFTAEVIKMVVGYTGLYQHPSYLYAYLTVDRGRCKLPSCSCYLRFGSHHALSMELELFIAKHDLIYHFSNI